MLEHFKLLKDQVAASLTLSMW